jgi:glutamate-1-semialdehyde 2,1-aminomutase
MDRSRSEAAFAQALKLLPGGVNSPVRALRNVGGTPFFVRRGSGSRIEDVDGNSYIDYVGAWGPMILGHGHAAVTEAVLAAAGRGFSFGAPTEAETELAGLITQCFPSMEKVRLVNSGTEATMSAVRLARGATGRPGVIKFTGCYHGHADHLLVKAGSGAMTFGVPDSLGVTEGQARDTYSLAFNDTAAMERLFRERGASVACAIVEPVVGNMGVVAPEPGFLETLRELCTSNGSVLIFDEVMTGFRVSLGGAQQRLGVRPDLTCLGKIIGGGLPVGAYGGPARLMDLVSPLGGVYQAGTNSGNPLSVACGIATLGVLRASCDYDALERRTEALCSGLAETAAATGTAVAVARAGSMFTVFFRRGLPRNLDDVVTCDAAAFRVFFHAMRDRGVSLPPSQYEAAFVSFAHSEQDIAATIEAAAAAFGQVRLSVSR